MAAIVSNTLFNQARLLIGTAKVNLLTDALKLIPMTTGFAPTVVTVADPDGSGALGAAIGITGVTGLKGNAAISAYIAPNVAEMALPGTITFLQNDTTNKAELKSTVTTMVAMTATGASTVIGFCLYDDTVTAPADPCLCYMLLDAPIVMAVDDHIDLTMPAAGWLNI